MEFWVDCCYTYLQALWLANEVDGEFYGNYSLPWFLFFYSFNKKIFNKFLIHFFYVASLGNMPKDI